MQIVVTFATGAEFRPWRGLRPFTPRGPRRWETAVGPLGVWAIVTGVGPAGAARAMERLAPAPRVCVASGLAGGLCPGLRRGDVLVARRVLMTGTEDSVHCHPVLVDLARRCGARPVDAFATSRRVLSRAAEKRRLGGTAQAVDMESFTVMHAMRGRGAAVVAIRAIVDPVERDLPLDFNRVLDSGGSVSAVRLLALAARRPARIPGIVRLAVESTSAARRLAEFLDSWLEALAVGNADLGTEAV